MPPKNAVKMYVEDGYYHIYNRGVEKRTIFLDRQDYNVFLKYIAEYLTPKDEKELSRLLADSRVSSLTKTKLLRTLNLKNYAHDISLMAYCLMPNHFHFFLQQRSPDSIDKFMGSLGTRYVTYFNRRYKRVGTLFQGVYKAVLINDEAQYLNISRYIHKQALFPETTGNHEYPSSYPEYLGRRKTRWIHPEDILSFFSPADHNLSYEKYVEHDEDDDIDSASEYEY
jgi:putative transposase